MSKWRAIGTPQPWSLDDAEERTGNGRSMPSSNIGKPYTRPGWSSGGRECRDPLDGSQNTHLYRDRGRDAFRLRDPMRERHPGMETDPVWERGLRSGRERDRITQRDSVREENPVCVGSAAFIPGLDVGLYGEAVDRGVLELSEGDQELARKKKELLLIEQEILRKKTFIAEKAQGGLPLEERVNAILNKRRRWQEYPSRVSSKPVACQKSLDQSPRRFRSFLERRNDSILSEDLKGGFCSEYKEEPPVKRRVTALMHHRRSTLLATSNDKNPVGPDPEKDPAAKGFQRFINILNRGVDIDRLAKIVNGDSDGRGNPLPPCSPSPLDIQSQRSHRSDSQGRDHFGAPRRDHGRSPSGERWMELTGLDGSQVKHHSRSLSPLTNSATGSHVGSRTRSRSPAPVERRKEPGLENELSHGQLQGLLQTIGLTLGEEELGRLTDRTQERLFGRKEDKERLLGKKEDKDKERLKECLLELHRCSSSSSSSPGPSPPHQLHSSDKASRDIRERSRTSADTHSRDRDRDRDGDRKRDGDRDRKRDGDRDRKRDGDRDRKRDGDRDRNRDGDRDRKRDGNRDRNRDGESDRDRDKDRERGKNRDRDRNKDRERIGDKDRNGDRHENRSRSREATDGQYPTNLPYPYPYPPPVIPSYTTAHNAQYTACLSRHYPGASLPNWGFPPGVMPPSPYPSGYPPPNHVNPLHYYNELSAASTHTDAYNQLTAYVEPEDFSELFNPDLSLSEGQELDHLRPRCLLEPQMKTSNKNVNTLVVVKKKVNKSKKTQKRVEYQKVRWQRRFSLGLVGRGGSQGNARGPQHTTNPQASSTSGPQAFSSPGPQAFRLPEPQAPSQGVRGLADTQQNTQIPHEKPLLLSEKRIMSEEEMKAQLKKKLAEFNLKMKQNPIQPKETVSMADEMD
ncbi:eukaryotic translation initiation factor 3 subunit A-like [Osmerus eperlanus]|uniref:eukaryotic translation initiation factor 3 subunit A-like n=1 Tax=Osmerus eperlanus TaxID=29151 RepID=UPI002E10DF39